VNAEASVHRARVAWAGDRDDLRAHTLRLGQQVVQGSSATTRGGDPTKADPEELFVGALSSCHMLWFLDFARRERLRVEAYEDDAEGEMDGVRFVRVTLHPRVEWRGGPPPDALVAALHERAHAACFVANSVTCPVEVAPP
jgi:organic hydroperoxide reductase OsmC/OhrA